MTVSKVQSVIWFSCTTASKQDQIGKIKIAIGISAETFMPEPKIRQSLKVRGHSFIVGFDGLLIPGRGKEGKEWVSNKREKKGQF